MTALRKRYRKFTVICCVSAATCLLVISFNYGDEGHVISERNKHRGPDSEQASRMNVSGTQTEFALSSTHRQRRNLIEMIADRADQDRYILLAMTDEAFVDMAINFYEASLRAHHVDNFLFVGIGNKTCQRMSRLKIPCFYYADDPSAGKSSSYGQLDFIRKMNFRTDMILEALAANFSVVHTDTDVVFLGNPLREIKTELRNYDMAPLWDTTVFNAGFVAMKASWGAQLVYNLSRKMTTQSQRLDDQAALNTAIKTAQKQQITFAVRRLSQAMFLSGHAYFERGRLFPRHKDCDPSQSFDCPLVVHNNWIVSKSAKVYRFREHLMWLYDGDDQYYSSQTRKYLTYTNPTSSEQSKVKERELSALRAALAIGYLTNRTVVLSRFHCGKHECPLNSLIRISTFDAGFSNCYRESSFLLHPKVPDAVKQELSHRHLNTSSELILSSNDILKQFGSITQKVVYVGSLIDIQIVFSESSDNAEFQQKLRKAIRHSNYRQY